MNRYKKMALTIGSDLHGKAYAGDKEDRRQKVTQGRTEISSCGGKPYTGDIPCLRICENTCPGQKGIGLKETTDNR